MSSRWLLPLLVSAVTTTVAGADDLKILDMRAAYSACLVGQAEARMGYFGKPLSESFDFAKHYCRRLEAPLRKLPPEYVDEEGGDGVNEADSVQSEALETLKRLVDPATSNGA